MPVRVQVPPPAPCLSNKNKTLTYFALQRVGFCKVERRELCESGLFFRLQPTHLVTATRSLWNCFFPHSPIKLAI